MLLDQRTLTLNNLASFRLIKGYKGLKPGQNNPVLLLGYITLTDYKVNSGKGFKINSYSNARRHLTWGESWLVFMAGPLFGFILKFLRLNSKVSLEKLRNSSSEILKSLGLIKKFL
jgi:hypothetical protein